MQQQTIWAQKNVRKAQFLIALIHLALFFAAMAIAAMLEAKRVHFPVGWALASSGGFFLFITGVYF